jgi:PleD family two-component response regulator
MRAWNRVLLLAAAPMVACGGSDPKESLDKIASTSAMAALTAGELHAHHLSRAYATVMLRELHDEAEQERAQAPSPAVAARADTATRAVAAALDSVARR